MLGFPGINPNIRDQDNMTALMHLVRSYKDGYFDAAMHFLEHQRININAVDNHGKSALHYAIDANNIKLAKTLMNHKDIDLQTGHTPLFAHAVKAKSGRFSKPF